MSEHEIEFTFWFREILKAINYIRIATSTRISRDCCSDVAKEIYCNG